MRLDPPRESRQHEYYEDVVFDALHQEPSLVEQLLLLKDYTDELSAEATAEAIVDRIAHAIVTAIEGHQYMLENGKDS